MRPPGYIRSTMTRRRINWEYVHRRKACDLGHGQAGRVEVSERKPRLPAMATPKGRDVGNRRTNKSREIEQAPDLYAGVEVNDDACEPPRTGAHLRQLVPNFGCLSAKHSISPGTITSYGTTDVAQLHKIEHLRAALSFNQSSVRHPTPYRSSSACLSQNSTS